MGRTKSDLVEELEKLNKKLGEDEQIEFDPEDTNKNLEALLEAGEKKVAAKEAKAGEGSQSDPPTDPPAGAKGKYTITTCNGKPYPSAKNPKVFEILKEAEEEAKFIKGTVDK